MDQTLLFQAFLRREKLPEAVPEFKFHDTRRWRADYAWPSYGLLLEVEGGVWMQGRHTRGSGFVKDMCKYNEAAMLGYRILRVTPKDLCKLETMDMIRRCIQHEAGNRKDQD